MTGAPSDLREMLKRLSSDPDFFAACQAAIRGRKGDQAILALLDLGARSGYRLTFEQMRRVQRQALDGMPPPAAPAARAKDNLFFRVAARRLGGRHRVRRFLKQW